MGRKIKRRQAGEGGISEYRLKDGSTVRYAAKFRDGQRQVLRRRDEKGQPFTTKAAVGAYLRRTLSKIEAGQYLEPSELPLGDWLTQWLAGLRLRPSTMASYRKNVRLHIRPYLGDVTLKTLTAAKIDAWMRGLERDGRRDHKAGQPLSGRTTKYCFMILSASLRAAVDQGLLSRNPAGKAHPPTAEQSKAPEHLAWSGEQLAAFMAWSAEHSSLHALWVTLAMTGARRGEVLGLRWRDLDPLKGTLAVRRSMGFNKVEGEAKRQIHEGSTKGGRSHVVDLDPGTVAVLKAWRSTLAGLSLMWAKDDALIFPSPATGGHRQPEHTSRDFVSTLKRCRKDLGESAPPMIRLHDLRHTHATILLDSGVPIKVVSERLGHANAVITLTTYAHTLPGRQREAADRLGSMVFGG